MTHGQSKEAANATAARENELPQTPATTTSFRFVRLPFRTEEIIKRILSTSDFMVLSHISGKTGGPIVFIGDVATGFILLRHIAQAAAFGMEMGPAALKPSGSLFGRQSRLIAGNKDPNSNRTSDAWSLCIQGVLNRLANESPQLGIAGKEFALCRFSIFEARIHLVKVPGEFHGCDESRDGLQRR